LHVDDGCAGWATTRSLAISLYDLLELHYPGVKWSIDKGEGDKYVCGWTEQLGFKVEHNPKTTKTKLTAPKHIEALKQFVSNDLHVTPKLPCSETIKGLKPEKVLEPQEPGYEQQQQDIKLMYECIGHIQHIAKVRMECKLAANICSRYSHAPCAIAIKNVKQCAPYHFI
jgi:hypothetical protein